MERAVELLNDGSELKLVILDELLTLICKLKLEEDIQKSDYIFCKSMSMLDIYRDRFMKIGVELALIEIQKEIDGE